MNKGNEEIIINGIDVSGCEYFKKYHIGGRYDCELNGCGCYGQGAIITGRSDCECNYDCYYKQLQRTKAQYNKVVEQNRSLQQENKELKEQLDTCKLNYHNDMEMNKAEIKELERDKNVFLKALKNVEKDITEALHCRYNTFDGGNSQRTKCIIDGCYCDASRSPNCHYKQLLREKQKNKELTEDYDELHQGHDKAFQDFERLKEKNFEVEVDNALKSHRIDYLEEQLEKLGWKEEVQNDR